MITPLRMQDVFSEIVHPSKLQVKFASLPGTRSTLKSGLRLGAPVRSYRFPYSPLFVFSPCTLCYNTLLAKGLPVLGTVPESHRLQVCSHPFRDMLWEVLWCHMEFRLAPTSISLSIILFGGPSLE